MDKTGKEALPKQCPLPSQAQLALAIAVVNSKPANISVIGKQQPGHRMSVYSSWENTF
jgi:hypothetical protein